MLKTFSTSIIVTVLLCFSLQVEASPKAGLFSSCPTTSAAATTLDGTPIMDIVVVICGVNPEWTPFGNGIYTVTVFDMNTFSLVTSFVTSSTNSVITGLQSGHTYLISVRSESVVVSGSATAN
jgi:hypothetical protein